MELARQSPPRCSPSLVPNLKWAPHLKNVVPSHWEKCDFESVVSFFSEDSCRKRGSLRPALHAKSKVSTMNIPNSNNGKKETLFKITFTWILWKKWASNSVTKYQSEADLFLTDIFIFNFFQEIMKYYPFSFCILIKSGFFSCCFFSGAEITQMKNDKE